MHPVGSEIEGRNSRGQGRFELLVDNTVYAPSCIIVFHPTILTDEGSVQLQCALFVLLLCCRYARISLFVLSVPFRISKLRAINKRGESRFPSPAPYLSTLFSSTLDHLIFLFEFFSVCRRYASIECTIIRFLFAPLNQVSVEDQTSWRTSIEA